MQYEKIVEGKFINRPNRFIAEVEIDGVVERVHVRNTGRCKELLLPGATVLLEDCRGVPNRKTAYSLVSVYKGSTLINMDSQIPNDVVYRALVDDKVESKSGLDYVKREVTYENSRFDIYYERGDVKGFIEVKGVTLEGDGIARFPDAPTTRGTKHINELVRAASEGYEASIFFLIQMDGVHEFKLNWETDPVFSETVLNASVNGVNILVYDSVVCETGISIGSPVPYDLSDYRQS